jgi:hypothetical protein
MMLAAALAPVAASVTLMSARQLKREIAKRDAVHALPE